MSSPSSGPCRRTRPGDARSARRSSLAPHPTNSDRLQPSLSGPLCTSPSSPVGTIAGISRAARAAPRRPRLRRLLKSRRRAAYTGARELSYPAARCSRAQGWAPEGWSRRLGPEVLAPCSGDRETTLRRSAPGLAPSRLSGHCRPANSLAVGAQPVGELVGGGADLL